MKQTKSTVAHSPVSKMLCKIYPDLHDFFVDEFGVDDNPSPNCYLQFLRHLSTGSSPSLEAKTVFQVFQKWSDGLESGVLRSDDIDYLKKSMEEKEMTILPTVQDKWVSLHQSFGLVCWCDDEELKKEFQNLKNVNFLCLGNLTTEEKQLFQDKVSALFRRLGISSLSEVAQQEYNFAFGALLVAHLFLTVVQLEAGWSYSFDGGQAKRYNLPFGLAKSRLQVVSKERLTFAFQSMHTMDLLRRCVSQEQSGIICPFGALSWYSFDAWSAKSYLGLIFVSDATLLSAVTMVDWINKWIDVAVGCGGSGIKFGVGSELEVRIKRSKSYVLLYRLEWSSRSGPKG
ncbi:hypothetical protein Tco_0897623 [Tanacetum coccineum]